MIVLISPRRAGVAVNAFSLVLMGAPRAFFALQHALARLKFSNRTHCAPLCCVVPRSKPACGARRAGGVSTFGISSRIAFVAAVAAHRRLILPSSAVEAL